LGYPDDIRNQECMIAYSGPKALFESCVTELNAMGGKARHIGENAGTAPLFDKAVYSFYYAHCLGLCHGAAMCEAMGAPLEVYLESLAIDWERHDSKILEMIRKRDYTAVEATMQVHAAAFSHVLPLSEKLGIDPALPKVISDCFETADKKGYGNSELPALFEILGKGHS
jgi:3-hydroxyisobutyrate dehydrogenase-like beta-hydroxyacid dehydrogenase